MPAKHLLEIRRPFPSSWLASGRSGGAHHGAEYSWSEALASDLLAVRRAGEAPTALWAWIAAGQLSHDSSEAVERLDAGPAGPLSLVPVSSSTAPPNDGPRHGEDGFSGDDCAADGGLSVLPVGLDRVEERQHALGEQRRSG